MSPRFRLAHRLSTALFVGVLLLVFADIGLGLELPQPLRGALPWALAGSLALAFTLGIGAYGAPKRPGSEGAADERAAAEDAGEAESAGDERPQPD